MLGFENRSATYVWYLSTGSAEDQRLQTSLT
jgi:hypothetical protein